MGHLAIGQRRSAFVGRTGRLERPVSATGERTRDQDNEHHTPAQSHFVGAFGCVKVMAREADAAASSS
ncbi:hypothetical protein, partial [Klebsiella pneumoniae]|uniref:hypothetical protein n=1 Tax=Klebsiella pneumoniae TaxID=573 RepID=UPI0019813F31